MPTLVPQIEDARHQERIAQEGQPSSSKLFDVHETDDGGFEAVLPGLFDPRREAIVGTSNERFATHEEAEQAVQRARDNSKVSFEQASLAKTYTGSFYKIDSTPEGTYRVVLPGLKDSKTGYFVGTTSKDFTTWNEAKTFYLQQRESEARLTSNPILELQTGADESIAFSDLDSYRPNVAPSERAHEIPPSVKEHLMQKEKVEGSHASAKTYQETVKESGWERKLHSFVSRYVEGDGAGIMTELGIERIDYLTPKQAIDLATRVVMDLTKYKKSDASPNQGDLLGEEKTHADTSTALQLLQEGLSQRGNREQWEGNGVCRNFASITKAVFEALKANQTKFNRLRDTYCLYEADNDSFAPKRKNRDTTILAETGHAWNTFVTVSSKEANAVSVDTTWAKKDLDTGKVQGLDYTLTRMERAVNEIGKNLQQDAPDREAQLGHILSYYQYKIERPGGTGGHSTPEQERGFLVTRAVELMTRQGVPAEIPQPLVAAIGQEFRQIAGDADRGEIQTIWRIAKSHPEVGFHGIFQEYSKSRQLTDYHANELIFEDDDLQFAVIDKLKSRDNFQQLMRESPIFRVRTRAVFPELLGEFSPSTQPPDASELRYLVTTSGVLGNLERHIPANNITESSIKLVYEKTRQLLRVINPSRYDETVAELDDYTIVKNAETLARDLQGAPKG